MKSPTRAANESFTKRARLNTLILSSARKGSVRLYRLGSFAAPSPTIPCTFCSVAQISLKNQHTPRLKMVLLFRFLSLCLMDHQGVIDIISYGHFLDQL